MSQRERAWQIHHYPCVGLYRFIHFSLCRHPIYQNTILPRLRAPNTDDIFLDVGTCFGQDVRKLIYDGVYPEGKIYASDILTEFWELGFELFRDRDRLPNELFLYPANLFDNDSGLNRIRGKISIIHMNAVFHLFNYESQLEMAKRTVKLLRPGPGTLIIGQQMGSLHAGEYASRWRDPDATIYRHNSESWAQMWGRVGKELASDMGGEEVKFKVESDLLPFDPPKGVDMPNGGQWSQSGFSRMQFAVERL